MSCSTDTELAPVGASMVCNVVSIGIPHQIPMPFMIEEYATWNWSEKNGVDHGYRNRYNLINFGHENEL